MEVQYVKGIGPPGAKVLAKLGIASLEDLLLYLPRRYEDRSNFRTIASVRAGEFVTLKGRLVAVESKAPRGNFTITRAGISDGSGTIGLVWFNQRWIRPRLSKITGEIIVYGQVKEGQWGYEINSPEWEPLAPEADGEEFARIVPVYPLVEGVPQKTIRRFVERGLAYVDKIEDVIPPGIARKSGLRPLAWSLQHVHRPTSLEDAETAKRRLVFEEFFSLQLALGMRHAEEGTRSGIAFRVGPELASEVEAAASVVLTGAQRRVIEEIYRDMGRPHPMNRLLQGDVGSGKTLVAAAAILAAARSGYQAALMAPTEILAEQHYVNLHRLFEALGLKVALLVGKQGKRERDKANKAVATGEAHVAVGTHALVQEAVTFHKLGLVVVDEQHKFGVLQRAALRRKGFGNPDVLVMTATPIPRSLTLTVYGDLDLSVIDEMPPGRRPIRTHWKLPSERDSVYEGVRKLLSEGAQAYVVCPLVSESEKVLAQAATELYDRLKHGALEGFRVGLLHGQQKAAEKEATMLAFRNKELDVLVSTTVIEVGVDVPNATVMIIEDANRYGLAQLHQLRGRVGRGGAQSYCVLIGAATNPETEERLRVMVETTDGFKIAEKDLEIRGPGEMFGTRQHGAFEFRVADVLRHGRILEEARQAALDLIAADPKLEKPEHAGLKARVETDSARLVRTDIT
ncbi:MAG: ATP-dependent DNA helicase RecG [Armatimonadetes bacterium]|nr:ATP-dependent DNA helicase RecG [Armatimonadota bacterium]NOG91958.1 ATP-dependent DNA helicase RecG [Armatimonadota bacterium]